ncbi:unnamed protein product [Kuraishia capsulata CBS 1993]|uniref:DUF676 domain-containing protein n=1 Tax=Kuraishia capsulata CBS 1993 TaxID=1382522 RepID=W6MIC2_9ASCO|nr:uncharacterized protein KUCA_T00000047001 [Kuraishia capsulata CBS 1993]CDK24087.1 unnamed protein product [Kuraishia capsulata CBS 1993]
MNVVEASLKQALKSVPNESFYYTNASNFEFLNTYTGVEDCSMKVLDQMFTDIEILRSEKKTRITKISFCGYSFGGLIARYCIGKLEEIGFFDEVKPVYFTTFATPHLGVRFFKDSLFNKSLNFLGSRCFGKSGSELFLHYSDMLLDLTRPESSYMKGLGLFKMRILLVNTQNDRSVAFYTGFITNYSPFEDTEPAKLEFLDNIPGLKIWGQMVKPRILNLEQSSRGTLATTGDETGRRMVLPVLLILPILVPLTLILTVTGTVYAYIFLLFRRKIDIAARWAKLTKYVYHGGRMATSEQNAIEEGKNLSTRHIGDRAMAELTQDAVEAVLDVDGKVQQESEEGLSSRSKTPSSEQSDDSSGLNSRFEILDEFESDASYDFESASSKVRDVFSSFKNLDLQASSLVTGIQPLPFDSKRMQMMHNLNSLDWYKIPVSLNNFNAHGAIVARRNEPRGIATTLFWASVIRSDIMGSLEE